MRLTHAALAALALLAAPAGARALPAGFTTGPVVPGFGPAIDVADADMTLDPAADWRVLFNAVGASGGELNRELESAARFVNMMARAGVAPTRIKAAVIVHGAAVFDVAGEAAYQRRFEGKANPNEALVAALRKAGVRIIVCGQSAAAQGVAKAELQDGVELALSAMTAFAVLEREGYALVTH